jgi:hypothetical protein
LVEGCRTADLGGDLSTGEFGSRVREHLQAKLDKHGALLQLIEMNRGCCG